MNTLDRRGNPVSADRKSVEALDRATDLLHGYFLDPLATIDAALADAPDFVMGHCFKAGLLATTTERGALGAMRDSVEAAEKHGARANPRERAHIAACRAWLDGHLDRGTALWGAILHDHPRDSLALQLAHLGDFFQGRSTMLRDRVAQVLPQWSEAVPGFGFVLGMHAFGLEESGDYGRAEATGRRALALNARDPWAVHAVAHVMEMQGRQADGIAWIERTAKDWAADNMFAYHNWWHQALYHWDLGEFDRALAIFDARVRPAPSAVALEMIDASALLWRLHLRGADVGARWQSLAESWASMAEDGFYAFNDAHAAMAFIGAGRDAELKKLLAAVEKAAAGPGTNGAMTRDVGLPYCLALAAFRDRQYDRTVDLLLPAREIAQRFGGSHAQRDLIQLTVQEAAHRAGRRGLAAALAAERIALKPSSPTNRLLFDRSRTGGLATAA